MISPRLNGAAVTNRLEQLFAVVVTAGLVLGNFLLFTPWRNSQDPQQSPSMPSQRGTTAEHHNP